MTARASLLHEIHTLIEQARLRLQELAARIEAIQLEVKKLQQRRVALAAQLKQVEAGIEALPRSDIRAAYTSAIDTQTRLLTLQGQFEKMQQAQTQLSAFVQTLQRLFSALDDVSPAKATPIQGNVGVPTTISTRLVEAQESQRKKLARQIHDGPAQALTNLILEAEICQRLIDRKPDRAAEELLNLKVSASTTFQRIRDFIFDLHPLMLDDLGLVPTLRRFVDSFADRSAISAQLTIVGDERCRMAAHIEAALFHAIQEILTYTRDIANSTRVELVLNITPGMIRATARFDGKDIQETEMALKQSSNSALGLQELRENIEFLGGTVQIFGRAAGNTVEIALASP